MGVMRAMIGEQVSKEEDKGERGKVVLAKKKRQTAFSAVVLHECDTNKEAIR